MRTRMVFNTAAFAKQGAAFETVRLPHTWNALDGQDGGGDYWRGCGSYILDLPLPSPGKKQYLEIKGANHAAVVTVNGRYIGIHKGGFSTFRFDITRAMKKEGSNQAVIEVSNAESDIYPQNADFTFFGGMYREAAFIEVESAHFDLLKEGSSGVFITPRINGLTRVDAFPVHAEGCTVTLSILNKEGNPVYHESADASAQTIFKFTLKTPRLWKGLEDPYLYTAVLELVKDGEIVDSVSAEYGYRSYHVDPERGFFLNGKSYPLRGVCRHQDREDMGWAITAKEHEEDIALICEVGANTIRLAHYQHDEYFYQLCDRAGLVIWAEIPFISGFISSKEAHDNTISQMTELICQNYNHASICFWGISNEITINGETEGLYQNLCELQALCKKLDPSRLTTMAQVSMVREDSEHCYITDVQSYNHYYGWYVGDVEDNGPMFDKWHAANPDRAFGISEYGAECVLNWHSAQPENHDYTEEYHCFYHHEMLKCFEARPYLWATHLWNMFDFAADNRNEGGVKGRNNKGIVTMDRKTKKDAFYIYKAYWTREPMIHVCGERFVDRDPSERDIIVYTNCDEVTLIINNRDYESRRAVDHCCVFENVPLMDGENIVTAICGKVKANEIRLNAVGEHNYAYDLPEGNEGANWFFDPAAIAAREKMVYPKDAYSIKDKLSDLYANPKTAEILAAFFAENTNQSSLLSSMNTKDKEEGSDFLGDFMKMMRLNNMLKMMMPELSLEKKAALNEALNSVKK